MKHLKIKIEKLEFNREIIFQNIDLIINKTDKIAIVWPNWAWKTSLIKIITWDNKNFSWTIDNVWNLSLWYLNQIFSDNEEKTVRNELKDGFKNIIILENKILEIEKLMEKRQEDIKLIEKYTSILDQYHNIWWNDYNNKIHQVANWMWILNLLDKKLNNISWWERTKVALAKILLESPDILFLDEPTNFIDMKSVEWLECFLQNKWKGWYVIISHDREFLNKTCNKTYEILPNNWLTFYNCNYSNYVIEREKIERRKLNNYKREIEYIEKEEKLINRFRAWSRAWWAKSREKSLNKREVILAPYIPIKPKFFFNYIWDLPNKVLNFKDLFIWRLEPLFFISDVTLYSWQRIWIVWDNWVWKSTFLKTIIWKLNPLDWFYWKWKAIKISYYSQLHEELDNNKSVRDNFILNWLNYLDQNLIWLLSNYLFEHNDLDKKVSSLSWWQRSKLLFAILWQKECNLLILDEPTNHLDYDTRESLENELNNFKWSILFISHDRYFVNKITTNIWFITKWELSVSYWNYEDYKFKLDHNIDMDINIFDEEAELNLVLEEKLDEKILRKIKNKFKKNLKN